MVFLTSCPGEAFAALDAIQLFLYAELVSLFVAKAWKVPSARQVNLAWAAAFLTFGFNHAMLVLVTRLPEVVPQTVQDAVEIVEVVVVVALLEYSAQRYWSTSYSITSLGVAFAAVVAFFPATERVVVLIYFFVVVFFGLTFFYKLLRRATGVARRQIAYFFAAFVAFLVGASLMAPRNLERFGSVGVDPGVPAVLGRVLEMVALVVLVVVLIELPPFFEVDWRGQLVRVYVVHKTAGVPLVTVELAPPSQTTEKDPQARGTGPSDVLVAGGMVGVSALLKEMSESRGDLRIVDQGDVKILLEHGHSFFIALLAKADLHVYREKLAKLRDDVEVLFADQLDAWDGNVAALAPLKVVVENAFSE